MLDSRLRWQGIARIIHECRREATETEAPIAPAHLRCAGTRPFPWASRKARGAMNKSAPCLCAPARSTTRRIRRVTCVDAREIVSGPCLREPAVS
jgi:hypothetical protein